MGSSLLWAIPSDFNFKASAEVEGGLEKPKRGFKHEVGFADWALRACHHEEEPVPGKKGAPKSQGLGHPAIARKKRGSTGRRRKGGGDKGRGAVQLTRTGR